MSFEDEMAQQMEAALNVVFAQGKRIASVQVTNEPVWEQRNMVIRFDDGTGLLITGKIVAVKNLEAEDVPGFEEFPEGERPIPPPSSPPPLLPEGDE